MPPVVTDWIFGTDNRLVLSGVRAGLESGEIDPREVQLGELIGEHAFCRSRSMIDSGQGPIRPEPSRLKLSSF